MHFCPSSVLKVRAKRVHPDALGKFLACQARPIPPKHDNCPDCERTIDAIEKIRPGWTGHNQDAKWVGINNSTNAFTIYEGTSSSEAESIAEFSVAYEPTGASGS